MVQIHMAVKNFFLRFLLCMMEIINSQSQDTSYYEISNGFFITLIIKACPGPVS